MIEERIVTSNQNHMALIYVNTKSVCCILALSRHIGQTGMSVRGDRGCWTRSGVVWTRAIQLMEPALLSRPRR